MIVYWDAADGTTLRIEWEGEEALKFASRAANLAWDWRVVDGLIRHAERLRAQRVITDRDPGDEHR